MKIIDLRSVTQWNKCNEKKQALQQTEKLTSENLKDPSDKHRTLETTCGREIDYLFNLSFFREKIGVFILCIIWGAYLRIKKRSGATKEREDRRATINRHLLSISIQQYSVRIFNRMSVKVQHVVYCARAWTLTNQVLKRGRDPLRENTGNFPRVLNEKSIQS